LFVKKFTGKRHTMYICVTSKHGLAWSVAFCQVNLANDPVLFTLKIFNKDLKIILRYLHVNWFFYGNADIFLDVNVFSLSK